MQEKTAVLVCKSGGEYCPAHAYWLERQLIAAGIYNIYTLSDFPPAVFPYPDKVLPLTQNLPGWWSKMEMFRPDLQLRDSDGNWVKRFLYVDLDTVVRKIPDEFFYSRQNIMLRDFYHPERGGASGFMLINAEESWKTWEIWANDPKLHMSMAGMFGDQYFLNAYMPHHYWQDLFPGRIASYKAHILTGFGTVEQSDVICFHGQPRPWDVSHLNTWIPQ